MIPVVELIYDIDRKLNKHSNLENQSIATEDKILALNEALIALIKNKVGWNNIYTLGLDAFKKRYEDLQILVQPYTETTPILKDKILNRWEVKLKDLPEYMMHISTYIKANKGECKDRTVVVERLTRHDQVLADLSDPHRKPSFEWQSTFGTLSNDNLELYTDGSFDLQQVYTSYLRYPKYIDVEGWEHLDGTPSINQDCELPYFLKDELINLTIKQISEITENVPQVQISQSNIQKQE